MLSSLLIYCKKNLFFTSRNPGSLSIFLSKPLEQEVMPEKSQKWLCSKGCWWDLQAHPKPRTQTGAGLWEFPQESLPNLQPVLIHRVIPEYAYLIQAVSDVLFFASKCGISIQVLLSGHSLALMVCVGLQAQVKLLKTNRIIWNTETCLRMFCLWKSKNAQLTMVSCRTTKNPEKSCNYKACPWPSHSRGHWMKTCKWCKELQSLSIPFTANPNA